MACSACALAQLGQTGSDGAKSWWSENMPLVLLGGAALAVGVFVLARDRCPDTYDDYVVAVRLGHDRTRDRALREARQMKCDWTAKVRR